MANFTGFTPASDYGCILNVGVTGGQVGLTNVLGQIQDAYGHGTPLSLSTIAFNISRSGYTFSLDSVAVTAAAIDINSMCQPNPIALGTSAIIVPRGTTADRSGGPVNGMFRYNTQTLSFEGYEAGSWVEFSTTGTGVTSLTGAPNQISLSASVGNITISLANNAVLPGAGGVTIPIGNTAARAGAAGTIRFNSQTNAFEGTTDGVTWTAFSLITLPISLADGGTNANLIASAGGIFYSTASAGAILGGTATATQMLQSGSNSPPAWSASTWPAGVGANGKILRSDGIDNLYSTFTIPNTYVLGDTLYASAANVLTALSGNTTAGKQYLSQTGTGAVSAAPIWASISGIDITGAALSKNDDANVTLTLTGTPTTALLRATTLTLGWTGTLSATRGGSGVSNPTAHGILIAEGASAFTPIVLGAGQILIGTTASDPSAAAIGSGSGILVANSSGAITVSNTGVLSNIAAANQITVSAATGNVTIGIASNPVFPGTGGATVPTGTTGQRAGAAGTIRFNTTTGFTEITNDGVTWSSLSTSTGTVTSVTGTTNRITSTGSANPVIDISAAYVGQSSITTVGTLISGSLAAGFTPVTVPIGGTGNTTFTAYSVICAGTTPTSAFQNVVGLGSSGQFLTSNGAAALPSWQTFATPNGSALTDTIVVANSFAVGQLLYLNGSTYTLAEANSAAAAEVVGIVTTASGSQFTITTDGYCTGLSGLIAGTVYYLSDATPGLLTSTAPTTVGNIIKAVFVADSTTSGFFVNYIGKVIPSPSAGGTVTSVAMTVSPSGAGAITGSPVTTSGTLGLTIKGSLLNIRFLTSGTGATYTPTTGTTQIIVDGVGGGSGGGSAVSSNTTFGAGGGGGGGGYFRKFITGINYLTYSATYTIGAGGAGGSIGNPGSSGSNTTYADGTVTLTASTGSAGGVGGGWAAGSNIDALSGGGGNASGGDLNIQGGGGLCGANSNAAGNRSIGGSGGGTAICPSTTNANAQNATPVPGQNGSVNSGAGGSGGGSLANNTGAAGGNGGSGIIIIYEFS